MQAKIKFCVDVAYGDEPDNISLPERKENTDWGSDKWMNELIN